MQIKAAKLEYVQRGLDGRVAVVSNDSQGVAEALERHDPCLQLWWLEDVLEHAPPVYAVFRVHRDGQPCSVEAMKDSGKDPEFVLSAMECDHRIVKRVEEIDGHGRSGYDFAKEVVRQNTQAEEAKHVRARERFAEHGEQLAHAIRYDQGQRYKGRATPHRYGRPAPSLKPKSG